jgi:hypothetical protein
VKSIAYPSALIFGERVPVSCKFRKMAPSRARPGIWVMLPSRDAAPASSGGAASVNPCFRPRGVFSYHSTMAPRSYSIWFSSGVRIPFSAA